MPLASFNHGGEQNGPSPSYEKAATQPLGRSLGTIFGYMAIGVTITLGVALLVGYLFLNLLGQRSADQIADLDGVVMAYLITLGVSFIVLLIMSFVVVRALMSPTRSAWPAFIIYATVMGVLLSSFVMLIDLWTLAEALGITILAFGVMFFIGRFSKVNLNPLGIVASGLLVMLLLLSIFWGFFAWLNPTAFSVFDLVFSIAVCALMMIITAVDAYNIKNILARGQSSKNVLLFCAYTLYSDFITLLIRILYLLLRLRGNRD